MSSTTLICGFKVSVAVLDAFLAANNLHETDGYPSFLDDHPDHDPNSRLCWPKSDGSTTARIKSVRIPVVEGVGLS